MGLPCIFVNVIQHNGPVVLVNNLPAAISIGHVIRVETRWCKAVVTIQNHIWIWEGWICLSFLIDICIVFVLSMCSVVNPSSPLLPHIIVLSLSWSRLGRLGIVIKSGIVIHGVLRQGGGGATVAMRTRGPAAFILRVLCIIL